MSTLFPTLGLLAALVAIPPTFRAAQQERASAGSGQAGTSAGGGSGDDARGGGEAVQQGRYLTHGVAMCVQCHTPRDPEGELLQDQAFSGAPIPVAAPEGLVEEWAFRAPNLRGLVGYEDEMVLRLLTEGLGESGEPPLPPMPRFEMTEKDARAVIAYLRSLP